jgi:proteic killer suppression protein
MKAKRLRNEYTVVRLLSMWPAYKIIVIFMGHILLTDISIYDIYIMIQYFGNRTAQDIYDGINSRYARKLPRTLHAKARRLLDQINAAPMLEFLLIPPGNRLEKMAGDLRGYWSLRSNEQWRILFHFEAGDLYDVKIADYHRS